MSKSDNVPSLAKMISTMSRIYHQQMLNKISPYDLNMTHFAIIMGLHATPGVSLNVFSQDKKINKAILSKALKKLQSQGLVELKKDKEHKQKYKIYITEEAQALVLPFRKALRAYEKSTLSGLDAQEQKVLLSLLAKVYNKTLA